MKKIATIQLIGYTPKICFNANKVTVLSVQTINNIPYAFIMHENEYGLSYLLDNDLKIKPIKTILVRFYICQNDNILPVDIDMYKYCGTITTTEDNAITAYHVFVTQSIIK